MRNCGNKAYFMKEEEMPPAPPDSGDNMMADLLTMTRFLSKRATG
jgi:hypothetical protein